MNAPTLAELAAALNLTLHGDGNLRISGVGTLESATGDQLSFLANPKYRAQLGLTAAGAVVAAADAIADARCPVLISRNPYADFARLAARFEPRPARFRCACSRERVRSMLVGLGREEIEDIIAERGDVEVGCDFCGLHYRFDTVDVGEMFAPTQDQQPGPSTLQ